ncbi:MAG: TerC family protein [Alphaproteobacteria bacterium]
MTLDSAFWFGLLEIIGVNIVLSGDNAVVIALACRSLPPRQQRIGVALGSGAAVAMRIVLTLFVTVLMRVPYLKIAGALLLVWIGLELLKGEEDEDEVHAAAHLWAAVRTVLIADAVMSLDNVIAVAAAAKGDMVLLVLGLLISIPLVVYGATLLIRLIGRFPAIITVGAALIGYIAGDVMVTDPALTPWVETSAPWLDVAAPILGSVFVVLFGLALAPQAVPAPETVRGAVGGTFVIFAVRALLQFFSRVVALRAPMVLASIAAVLGFGGGEAMIEDAAMPGWAGRHTTFVREFGPVLGSALAVTIIELAVRWWQRRGARRHLGNPMAK